MPERRRIGFRLLPFAVAAAVVLADRVSKVSVRHTMTRFDSISILPGWIRIIHTENPGAAFGVLAEGNPIARTIVLIGVSAIVLLFVARALWSHNTPFTAPAARFALALILGGAVGNLYDRIVHGAVTDFFEVYHGSWSFPAFNVADSAITVGAFLLIIELLRPRRKRLEEHAGFAHK